MERISERIDTISLELNWTEAFINTDTRLPASSAVKSCSVLISADIVLAVTLKSENPALNHNLVSAGNMAHILYVAQSLSGLLRQIMSRESQVLPATGQ